MSDNVEKRFETEIYIYIYIYIYRGERERETDREREGSQSYGTCVRRQFGIRVEWHSLNGGLEYANTSGAVSSAVNEAYFYDHSYMFCPQV